MEENLQHRGNRGILLEISGLNREIFGGITMAWENIGILKRISDQEVSTRIIWGIIVAGRNSELLKGILGLWKYQGEFQI